VWNRVLIVTDVASGSLVAAATGDVTDLAPEVTAAQAAFPGPRPPWSRSATTSATWRCSATTPLSSPVC
jgi:hypothetical protein